MAAGAAELDDERPDYNVLLTLRYVDQWINVTTPRFRIARCRDLQQRARQLLIEIVEE